MHAWIADAYGPPETLRWGELPDMALSDGDIRIEVRAAGVNFPDVLFIAGSYQVKPPPPFVPGFEVAGVVTESRAPGFPIGTRVAGMPERSGAYATEVTTSADGMWAIPDAMTFEHAAAITIIYQTGWFALHRRAALRRGETLLVHAGAGGVGSAAIQLGKAAGARVVATAGGPEKLAVCRALGADEAIDYRSDDFVGRVKEITHGNGADVIFDPVGGDVFDKSTKCIAFEGRIIVVGFTSGRFADAHTNHVLVKNYSVVGLHWGMYRGRDPEAVAHAQREINAMYARGAIAPLVSSTRPMREAPAAIAAVAARGSTGKVVVVR